LAVTPETSYTVRYETTYWNAIYGIDVYKPCGYYKSAAETAQLIGDAAILDLSGGNTASDINLNLLYQPLIGIGIPDISLTEGNEIVDILSPAAYGWKNNVTSIGGTATNIDNDLTAVAVSIWKLDQNGLPWYLDSTTAGTFCSSTEITHSAVLEGSGATVNWTLPLNGVEFAEGEYYIRALAQDALAGTAETSSFYVDKTAPALESVFCSSSGQYVSGDQIQIAFTEPVAKASFTINMFNNALSAASSGASFGTGAVVSFAEEYGDYARIINITLGSDVNIPSAGLTFQLAAADIIDRAGNLATDNANLQIPALGQSGVPEQAFITCPGEAAWVNSLETISGIATNNSGNLSAVRVAIKDTPKKYLNSSATAFDSVDPVYHNAVLNVSESTATWSLDLTGLVWSEGLYRIFTSACAEEWGDESSSCFYIDKTAPALSRVKAQANLQGTAHSYDPGDKITVLFSEPVLISNLTLGRFNEALSVVNTANTFGTTGAKVTPIGEAAGYAQSFEITLGNDVNLPYRGIEFTLRTEDIVDRAGNTGRCP
jgi:hypothetical protein